MNQQMKELLGTVLKDTLHVDCIQSIVDFVIGRVLYIEHEDSNAEQEMNEETTQRSGLKRPLEVEAPSAKRRRLNDENV